MALNGAGVYSIKSPEYPLVAGSLAKAEDLNAILVDLKGALDKAFYRDGQATATGDLPMGGNRLTNLSNASANGHAVPWQQIAVNGVSTGPGLIPFSSATAYTAGTLGESAALLIKAFRPSSVYSTEVPHIGMGVNPVDESLAVIQTKTTRDPDVGAEVQIQRFHDVSVTPWAGTKSNLYVPNLVGDSGGAAVTLGKATNAIISATVYEGADASAGVHLLELFGTTSSADADLAGFRMEMRQNLTFSGPLLVTEQYGGEVKLVATGLDRPSAGLLPGVRHGLRIMAATDATLIADPDYAVAEIGVGLYVGCETATTGDTRQGSWRIGVFVTDEGSVSITRSAFESHSKADYGFYSSANPTVAVFSADNSATSPTPWGLLFTGTNFGLGAIGMQANQKITMSITDGVDIYYDAVTDRLYFTKGVLGGYINMAGAMHAC